MTSPEQRRRRGRYDVAVVGLGPAGRSLASRCDALGLSVLVVDPRPDAPWTPTYGLWAEQLGPLPSDVVASRIARPEVRARGRHVLPREYVVLDNAALQRALRLGSAQVRTQRLDDAQMVALRSEAAVVVDARGPRPLGGGRPAGGSGDGAPAQTAFGIVVPADEAAVAMDGAEGLLMDWRTDYGPTSAAHHGAETPETRDRPTFLYAIPLGADEVLLEETCLAAAPGLPLGTLRDRLQRRLRARGMSQEVIDNPVRREAVWIPMRGRGRPAPDGVLTVGTAGRGGNVVTGYSVAHALATAPRLAARLAGGAPPRHVDPPAPSDLVREAGLRALLRLPVEGTLDLFDAFGRLPVERQRAFWSREAGAGDLTGAMWGMFLRMPMRSRAQLTRATLGP